jgi:hypothetical protein
MVTDNLVLREAALNELEICMHIGKESVYLISVYDINKLAFKIISIIIIVFVI